MKDIKKLTDDELLDYAYELQKRINYFYEKDVYRNIGTFIGIDKYIKLIFLQYCRNYTNMYDFITYVLNSDMISDKKIIEYLKLAKSYFKNIQPIDEEYSLSYKYLEYLKKFILDYASNNKIIDVLNNLELSFDDRRIIVMYEYGSDFYDYSNKQELDEIISEYGWTKNDKSNFSENIIKNAKKDLRNFNFKETIEYITKLEKINNYVNFEMFEKDEALTYTNFILNNICKMKFTTKLVETVVLAE